MDRKTPLDARAEAVLADLLSRADEPERLALAPGVAATVMRRVRDIVSRRPADRTRLIEGYVRGLSHPKPRVRFECAHGLDAFGGRESRDVLVALMDDPVPRVRRMALHALSCDACKDALLDVDDDIRHRIAEHALTDESVQVRRHAVWAVGQAGGEQARSTLEAVLAHDGDPAVLRQAHAAMRLLDRQTTAR